MDRINLILLIATTISMLPLQTARCADKDTIPSLTKSDASFSMFPDSVTASVADETGVSSNWDCPSADVFSFPKGPRLAVCGSLSPEPSRAGTYLIGLKSDFFFIVVKDKNGITHLLLEGGGSGGNPALLEPRPGREFRYIEALQDSARYYSVFQTPILCDQKSCALGKESCAVDIPKDIHPDVFRRLDAEKRKKIRRGKNAEAYMNLVAGYSHELLMRSLTGDRRAADLLMNHFPFDLDAAPAEIVGADRDTYSRAKKLGCRGL
jgi:hypothetical protein